MWPAREVGNNAGYLRYSPTPPERRPEAHCLFDGQAMAAKDIDSLEHSVAHWQVTQHKSDHKKKLLSM
jgi:hypothetical protein